MPTLPPQIGVELDQPITLEELNNALKHTKSGKAPGPDGYTVDFYKTKYLLEVFNHLAEAPPRTKDIFRAVISLIPKEGKDQAQCDSYRPIALLNGDLKLFAKILADRLIRVIPGLIKLDQVGFVPGREGRDNTIRVIDVIQKAVDNDIDLMLLSTDANKAFDRVGWPFMQAAIEHIGFGARMRAWIGALYSCPSAAVKVNGQYSNFFDQSNGTRQGCPLSPLMFIITLEPFLCKIRNNEGISGLKVGHRVQKLAAYADDLIFFISNPEQSVPSLLEELRTFRELAYYKINYS